MQVSIRPREQARQSLARVTDQLTELPNRSLFMDRIGQALNAYQPDYKGYYPPDFGLLYVGVGDGGNGGDPLNMAQDMSNAFGKIFRIDPLGRNSRNKKYGIPASNPFVTMKDALPEIYALGLRNVVTEITEHGDHYDPGAKVVRLSADMDEGRAPGPARDTASARLSASFSFDACASRPVRIS